MVGRVVEIVNDGRHLSVDRGFLVVEAPDTETGRVALDEIGAVIANAHGISYSNNLLVTLARRGIPVILCGPQHRPEAILWPVVGHHVQSGRMTDQANAPAALKKRLWRDLVRSKILMQGATLAAVGARGQGFLLLARKVRSGDPDNVEAEAARRYWPLLFGGAFRRDQDGGGINALLNYGYAVLRAAVARAVMGCGLHPSLGLMHSNRGNAMVLVDDLMEPFRPIVDLEVHGLARQGTVELNAEAKATLARLMVLDMPTERGLSPLMMAVERLCQSLAAVYGGVEQKLALPRAALPLESRMRQGTRAPQDEEEQ